MRPARFNHVHVHGTSVMKSFCESCHMSVGASSRSDVLQMIEKVHAGSPRHNDDKPPKRLRKTARCNT